MKRVVPHAVWSLVALLMGAAGFALGSARQEETAAQAASTVDGIAAPFAEAVVEADAGTGTDGGASDGGVGAPPQVLDAYLEAVLLRTDPMTIPQSADAPVTVLSARVFERYNYKKLEFRVQSNTPDTIDGIRFTAFCFDQFNDPVRNQHSRIGRTNAMMGTYQQNLRGRATRTLGYWDLFGQDTCTKAIVVVREVHFEDGTMWQGYSIQQSDPRLPAAPERAAPERPSRRSARDIDPFMLPE